MTQAPQSPENPPGQGPAGRPASTGGVRPPWMAAMLGQQRPRWLTWNKVSVITGVVLAVGLLLVMLHPIWLAPPNFHLTPVMYGLIAIAWIPVMFVLSLFKPAGRGETARWVLLGGAVISVGWLVLFAPDIGGFLFVGQTLCREMPPDDAPPGAVRYVCENDFLQGHAGYVLEGYAGSPFAWIVEAEASGFD